MDAPLSVNSDLRCCEQWFEDQEILFQLGFQNIAFITASFPLLSNLYSINGLVFAHLSFFLSTTWHRAVLNMICVGSPFCGPVFQWPLGPKQVTLLDCLAVIGCLTDVHSFGLCHSALTWKILQGLHVYTYSTTQQSPNTMICLHAIRVLCEKLLYSLTCDKGNLPLGR